MATSTGLRATVRTLGVVLMATAMVACGSAAPAGSTGTGAGAASPPTTTGAGSSGSPGPGGAAAGLCGLFTPAELEPVLGAQPDPGSGGGPLESLCEWDAGDADLMIQKVPAEYFEDRRGTAGYRELEGLGEDAYVAPHPFGRMAAALTADAAYIVIASDGADEAALIELLRLFIERSPGDPVLSGPEEPGATDPPGTPAPGTPAPGGAADCPVTSDEVSRVAGIEMTQGDGCAWVAADAGTLYEVLLSDMPMAYFEYVRGEQLVEGVGDEAYADGTGALYVRVGGRAVSIHVVTLGLDEQEALDVAIEIARLAADDL